MIPPPVTQNPAESQRSSGFFAAACFGLMLALLTLLIVPASLQKIGFVAVVGMLGTIVILSRFPELFLVLFLFAGQFKGNPLFAPLAAVFDITVLTAMLTILGIGYVLFIEKRLIDLDKRALLLWYLFCCLMIASLLWTDSLTYGWEKAARFVTLGSLSFVAPILLLAGEGYIRRFFYALAGFCAIYSASGLYTGMTGDSGSGFISVAGANYLALASIGGVGVIVALLYLLPRGGWSSIAGLLVSVVSGEALLLSGGRGPLIALIGTMLCITIAGLLAPAIFGRTTAMLSILLTLVFLGLFLFDLLPETLTYRLGLLLPDAWQSGVVVQENAETGRPERWQAAWEAFSTHPIRGLGSGGFAPWFWREDVRDYPHNIFFEAAAELGVPGLFVVFALFWLPTSTLLRTAHGGEALELRLLRVTALGLMLFGWIEAQFSGDFNDNRFVWLISGMLAALSQWQAGVRPDRSLRSHQVSTVKNAMMVKGVAAIESPERTN